MGVLTLLALVWTAVGLSAVLARITRLTPVLWYLFFGAIMVNTGLLPEHPPAFLRDLSMLGIVLIMFALGFEESTEQFLSSVKKSWGIAFFGGIAPFISAYSVAWFIWHDIPIATMCGLAMTATAVSLTMVSLKGEGLAKSPVATRIMTSAVLDDIAALILVAILVPLAAGQAAVDLFGMMLIAGKAVMFFVIVSLLGAWMFPHAPRHWIRHLPVIGDRGIRDILTFDSGAQATLIVLLIAVVVGLVASAFGFHPAVGAYMAGLILKEEYFDTDKVEEEASEYAGYNEVKHIIDNVAFVWIGPVFFVGLGAEIIFDATLFMSVLPFAAVMTSVLFVAQISSAALAARFTGGMDWAGSFLIGFGMLGRAELAFVVMDIAYVQNTILPETAFYTLMFTAFALNIAVPVTIRLWKPVYAKSYPPDS
jgi:Kef-type K+ transport system membrane component KefB